MRLSACPPEALYIMDEATPLTLGGVASFSFGFKREEYTRP